MELDDGVTGVEEGLPRMNSSKRDVRSAFNTGRVADGVRGGARLASRLKRPVAGGLRIRLGIILGVMWLLNMVSIQLQDIHPNLWQLS